MTLLLGAGLLALTAGAWLLLPRHLAGSAWPTRAPATALQLWQASLFTGLLALLGAGALLGLRPLDADVPHAVLAAVDGRLPLRAGTFLGAVSSAALILTVAVALAVLVESVQELRHTRWRRSRQRTLLDLVATRHPEWPGVTVLEHPVPVAYSFPGRPPRVVLSRGVFAELTPAQIRAVLAHEQAHLQQRHHIVALPFAVARRSRVRRARRAYEEVAGLLEMCADDAVRRQHGDWALMSALVHMTEAASGFRAPPGSLAAADRRCVDRVWRLVDATPRPRWLPAAGHVAAIGLLSTPIAAIAVPCLLL